MKKAITTFIIVIRAILLFLIVVIDRFTMALFIGVPLPDMNYKKDVPKVDENTTDDQIEQIVDLEDRLKTSYVKDYIPKARRRALTIISTLTSYYLFTILSWTTLGIVAGTAALIVTSILVSRRFTRKRDKKPV